MKNRWITPIILCTAALSAGCAVDANGDPSFEELALEEGTTREEEQSIVNGSTNFSGKEWMRDRTAGLASNSNAATKPFCSGTFLDPRTVITARHCVSTNGQGDGPIPTSYANLFVQRFGDSKKAVSKVVGMDTDHDVALIFLSPANRIVDAGGKLIFTPIEPIEPAAYVDQGIYISGWGRSENDGGGTSALRYGRMFVHDYYVGSFQGYDDGIKLRQTSADQRGAPGDSGGPYWGDATQPPGIIGIHHGDTAGLDPREIGTQAHAVREWALREISEDHGLDGGIAYSNGFATSSGLNKTFIETLGSDPANWQSGGGQLVQSNNASKSVVVWQELLGADFTARIDISSPDDDGAGIVFHYVDKDNFVYCIANEGGNYLKMRERFNGTEREIASATWNGTWSTARRMQVSTGRGAYTDCSFDGVTIRGAQYRMPVGAIGVIQDYNKGVSFQSLFYEGSRFTL